VGLGSCESAGVFLESVRVVLAICGCGGGAESFTSRSAAELAVGSCAFEVSVSLSSLFASVAMSEVGEGEEGLMDSAICSAAA